jgi:YD repeat-containing protein
VIFPATGSGYVFSYSAYGMIYNYSVRRGMSSSDGTESASVNFNYPTVASSLTDAPSFTQRVENAVSAPTSTYTYGVYNGVGDTAYIIWQPDGTRHVLSRYNPGTAVSGGLLYYKQILDTAGVALKTVTFSYANDGGGSPQVQYVFDYNDLGTPTLVGFEYDSYGNVTNRREYGTQIGGQWVARRRARFVYKTDSAYVTANIRNRVTEAAVYDVAASDTTPIAKTTYTYDNYAAMGGMEEYTGQTAPPHHTGAGATSTVRGNVTGTSRFVDIAAGTSITRLAKYDKYGNVVKAQVSCCQEKTFEHDEDTYWSLPEEVTSVGGGAGTSNLTTESEIDFNTSLAESRTDPSNQTVNYGYDAAHRVNSVSLPSGTSQSATYDDGSLSTSSTVEYDAGGVTKTLTTESQMDGWGRVIESVNASGVQVNTTDDA